MLALPPPAHLPCDRCGASVPRASVDAHVCDRERRLDYRLFALRGEVAAFERELGAWLETPAGRFARYCAERARP